MKQLAPRGRQLKPRGQSGPAPVRTRDRVDTWRAWYKTAEWRAIRWDVLVSAAFTCVGCKRVYQSADLVGDHKGPHRGDRDLFFDRTNVQCMCATCQTWAEEVQEHGGGASSATGNCRVSAQSIRNLQFKANKTAASVNKINALRVVQTGIFSFRKHRLKGGHRNGLQRPHPEISL